MQPDLLSPADWLAHAPLQAGEQLFAVFSHASAAKPPGAWLDAASPLWAETVYAEWDAVMPCVGIVSVDSEFLHWVTDTESRDWGWLLVSSASLEGLVEHFRSLTQVLMPKGKTVFFRFWDGRFLLPLLQSDEVDARQLFPVVSRSLINGQALHIGGAVRSSGKVFPWWRVPESVLVQEGNAVRTTNAMQWLSEENPVIFEAFPEAVLCCKVGQFFQLSMSEDSSQSALLAYLLAELE